MTKSNRQLVNIGNQVLGKRAPLLKEESKFDEKPITTFNKLLEPLSPEVFNAIIKTVKMPSFLAIPLFQMTTKHPEILHPIQKLPEWKQVQYLLRHFCPLDTRWSRRDIQDFAGYCSNLDLLTTLIQRHRIKSNQNVSLCKFNNMCEFNNDEFVIWFIKDDLLEFKILLERNWLERQNIYPNVSDMEIEEMKPHHEKYLKDKVDNKTTDEIDEWCSFYHEGFSKSCPYKNSKNKIDINFKHRASELAYAIGFGEGCDLSRNSLKNDSNYAKSCNNFYEIYPNGELQRPPYYYFTYPERIGQRIGDRDDLPLSDEEFSRWRMGRRLLRNADIMQR